MGSVDEHSKRLGIFVSERERVVSEVALKRLENVLVALVAMLDGEVVQVSLEQSGEGLLLLGFQRELYRYKVKEVPRGCVAALRGEVV